MLPFLRNRRPTTDVDAQAEPARPPRLEAVRVLQDDHELQAAIDRAAAFEQRSVRLAMARVEKYTTLAADEARRAASQ
jgi:hypothetical protein